MKNWIKKYKKNIITVLACVVVVALVSSGWIYSVVKNNQQAQDNEMAQLNASFQQQYGNAGLTVSQIVSVDKIYAVAASDNNGNKYAIVNIAGIWGVWWQAGIPEQ